MQIQYTGCSILNNALNLSKTMIDTEKCFKQKFYGLEGDIRRHH